MSLKKLFTEFLANRSTPAPFTWLNLYLEKIRSKIFSMDNVLQMIEGRGVGLCIDAILDNILKSGGKDEQYKSSHRMWASSNCSIESVFASAMVIYQEVPSRKFRFYCRCCEKSVHNSFSGGYNSLHEIMQRTYHMFPSHIG